MENLFVNIGALRIKEVGWSLIIAGLIIVHLINFCQLKFVCCLFLYLPVIFSNRHG